MQLDNDVDLICRVIPVVLDTLNQQQSLFCGILTFEDIGTLPLRNPQSVEKVQNLEDPRLSNLPKHRVPILSMTRCSPMELQIHGFVFPSRRTLHTESQADETRFCEIAVKRLCTWPRIVRPREQLFRLLFHKPSKAHSEPFHRTHTGCFPIVHSSKNSYQARSSKQAHSSCSTNGTLPCPEHGTLPFPGTLPCPEHGTLPFVEKAGHSANGGTTSVLV